MTNLELIVLGISIGVPVGAILDRFVLRPIVDLNVALRRGGRGSRQ